MKFLLRIVPCFLLLAPLLAAEADDDWRKAAREFLKEHHFAPIEVKPGTRFQSDLSRDRWQWQQRVLLPTLEKHLEKWPSQAERARSLVKQALLAKIRHPDVDRSRTPEKMEQEGLELAKAGVDEPLVLWATAWAAWEWREGYIDAIAKLKNAAQHSLTKDYPAALLLLTRTLIREIEDDRNEEEPTHEEDYYRAAMQAAKDPRSYSSQDDEILWHDVQRMFYRLYLAKHLKETEAFARDERFTPWLREMMQGQLQSSQGIESRGGGYANTVTADGWKSFEKHMPVAAAHFRKAWELHPERADAAEQMVEILKSGFGIEGETTRLWFDRAVAAQFDATGAYYGYVWSLRPRWGGSVDDIRCLLLACALTDRPDTDVAEVALKLVDFVKSDSGAEDERAVLQTPALKQALLHTSRRLADEPSRIWERPWRLADLGVYAWKAAEYPLADDILHQVPVPFPRQTRRKLNLAANETEVRGQSAIFAIGMQQEWEAAETEYSNHKISQSLQTCQDIASRFQNEPPAMLLEHMAACKFETSFATGEWLQMQARPDMAEWHHLSGPWTGSPDGTLQIIGKDAQAYILHNGRVGGDFELRGSYTLEGDDPFQGLSIMLGYHRPKKESFIACSQWKNDSDGSIVTLLRDFAQTSAPSIILRGDDRTWRFHIFCKNGRVTFRLNHRDVLIDYLDMNKQGKAFEMAESGLIGFCSHFFGIGTTTNIRDLEIRKLSAEEAAPSPDIAGLHQMLPSEIAARLAEARHENKTAEADKIEAFGKAVQTAGTTPVPLPPVTLDERILHSLLRGYRQSVSTRLALAGKPVEPSRHEEPLASFNAVEWEPMKGTWTMADGALTGSGDSSLSYDFHRSPPFQIDLEIKVLDGMRPRLVLGNVKFANEGYATTFGLYPQPQGAALFKYERNKSYQITLKALTDKTELLVNGVHVCNGPKIEGTVDILQFRGGDDYSKGKTEFRKIRARSLP
ncbi:hypothetical protein [Prosthecobacter sp.]|uniref:hypothetical protein n=1 Tax=Prosthecobacter sp. TaxID=1965333 RepID=UPI0024883C43|nr:hypothetical protein [Prosthecobacter sp.]MDI1314149.1 hypothetical protein [Prosthecobacter sp.]